MGLITKNGSITKLMSLIGSTIILLPTLIFWSFPFYSSCVRDIPSVVLKIQRRYATTPPHDRSLYDCLGVRANATSVEIVKAYRNRCRLYHPDKQKKTHENNEKEDFEKKKQKRELERVRNAFEVLKSDSTRLPYHKFGLTDGGNGRQTSRILKIHEETIGNRDDDEVWLGHWFAKDPHGVAARLVEILRPLVEEKITPSEFAHGIAAECDALKHLPFGAQILRCVGRAYRDAGRAFLLHSRKTPLTLSTKGRWRIGKDLMEAAFAAGKWLCAEESERIRRTGFFGASKQSEIVDKYFLDDESEEDEDTEFEPLDDNQFREMECTEARAAIRKILELDALWKISKVRLDDTVQKGCRLLLSNVDAFFPTSFGRARIGGKGTNEKIDGWVGLHNQGVVINSSDAVHRSATSLILLGEVLVRCSKRGTSWRQNTNFFKTLPNFVRNSAIIK